MDLTRAGQSERDKAVVHGVLFAGCAICFAYSVITFRARPSRQLAINACVYGAGLVFEWRNLTDHLSHADRLGVASLGALSTPDGETDGPAVGVLVRRRPQAR